MNKTLLGVAAASAMLFATAASASLMLTIEDLDGTTTANSTLVTVVDTDENGRVNLTDTMVGDWLVDSASGFGEPSIFLGPQQLMHLGSVDATSASGAGTLRITLEDDAYVGNISSVVFDVAAENTVGTSEFWAYVDGIEFAHIGPDGTFSYFSDEFAITTNPFSLKIVAEINHVSRGVSSFDANVNVPEPSVLALMSLGLVGLGFAGRRKLK